MESKRKSLKQLFIPICLEIFCAMLAGMVDTAMLSSVSDEAVGAVGTANTYLNLFIIMFSVISAGMIAVMTQYIGAGKPGVAYQARQIGTVFNAVIGVILSVGLFAFSDQIAVAAGIAPKLRAYAGTYLRIVGGSSILNALIPIFSSYLRAFGHTKPPMAAAVFANILNLVLNAVFLFIFQMGVMGVAIATVLSRAANLVIVLAASRRCISAKDSPERVSNKKIAGQIIRIGLPSALETALYNLAMALIIRFMNQMDPDGMNVTARSYASIISNFSYCIGAALAQANAIITGWQIGAGEYDRCDRETKRAALVSIAVASATAAVFAVFSEPIMGMFTDDPAMIALVGKLLMVDIVLEVGRGANLVFGQALKTSGDAMFTTVIAAVFMYLCAVGGTYLFGIRMEMLAVGTYIAMALDECVRAVCMYGRWRSGIWRGKGLT